MKERPILFSAPMVRAILNGTQTQTRRVVKCRDGLDALAMHQYGKCPYGSTGDRLWVRETWQEVGDAFYYRATDEKEYASVLGAWRPSIHMPRKASRLTLEVVSVRVERLNQISVADCHSEGVDPTWDKQPSEIESYERLWDSINGKSHLWASNPWVWVVEFKRVEGPR